MKMDAPCAFNVFVGSETGFIKGVNTYKTEFRNLNAVRKVGTGVDKNEEITCMRWGDQQENMIVMGLRNQTVKTFNLDSENFSSEVETVGGEGPLKGVGLYNRNLLTCTESGFVKLWSKKKKQQVEIQVGDNVWRMHQNIQFPEKFATGGKENDLKIWDLQTPEKPFFTAKNVRDDFLDLRVPVWICDMKFIPDSERIISTTGYHQVRLYDPKINQRRPVISMEVDEYPLLTLSLAQRENQMVIGNSRGRLMLIDLRKRALVHVFKGCIAGSVRHVVCHPTLPLVASCGLDRHLRIHDINTRKILCKSYLKSRLNCLLLKSDFTSCAPECPENGRDIPNVQEILESESLWQQIEVASGDEKDIASRQIVSRKRGTQYKEKPHKKRTCT